MISFMLYNANDQSCSSTKRWAQSHQWWSLFDILHYLKPWPPVLLIYPQQSRKRFLRFVKIYLLSRSLATPLQEVITSFPASQVDHHNNISFEKESSLLSKLSAKTVSFSYFWFCTNELLKENILNKLSCLIGKMFWNIQHQWIQVEN